MPEHAHRMRPLTDLLPVDEALRRILAACEPVTPVETVPLVEAAGRVLADDVAAAVDVPSFDRAAMDGYAVRAGDAAHAPSRLRIVGNVHAGAHEPGPVAAGQAVQIATGAPLPPGADSVVPVEHTHLEGTDVVLERPVALRQNVSLRASDLARGTRVLARGAPLTPARIAVAAAAGHAHARVWRRPRVTILSTGSELQPAGEPLRPGAIYDSNGPALAALMRSEGADVVQKRRVADDVDAMREALREAAARSDLILASGASSAGEHDVLRDAVRAEGRIEFHGVRVKPGKPLLLGRIATTPLLGLPGYPTSCLSDAYLFVLPGLRRMAHLPEAPPRRLLLRLASRVDSVPGRVWFMPVRVEGPLAVPTYKESGATTSLADAVGYVIVRPDSPFLEQGEPVDVILF